MRVALLGGTRFIGRAILEELTAAGHEVCVIHRGTSEPPDLPEAKHLHLDRSQIPDKAQEIRALGIEVFVDTYAMSKLDAKNALSAIPDQVRTLVLSSMDVYRAYEAFHTGVATEPVPLKEASPTREKRYPYRGKLEGMEDYEKLDVEEAYLERDATVLRLPFVYGERDEQRRQEFVLRRIRASRKRMPIGAGNWIGTHGYVRDVARGVRLALESEKAVGQVINLGEPESRSVRQIAEAVIEASEADLELVRVPDDRLPLDLRITGAIPQQFIVDSSKAREMLGWECADWYESIKVTVDWHLSNSPEVTDQDFAADDKALEKSELGDLSVR
ncbi:MAG: NAD-dependent epimerase/dehydratase family protein [Actinobacteria bacterium]|nr:NAD-dependent epimerase/dehydratase family protein [Actinomycetota bacterium]